jgi:hypothetical protein
MPSLRATDVERAFPGSMTAITWRSAPAAVADRSDPKIVHLDGLNLSRAWCMAGVAAALPANDPARAVLIESAARHAGETLAHVASGQYEGEHWLATFAVYALCELERLGSTEEERSK